MTGVGVNLGPRGWLVFVNTFLGREGGYTLATWIMDLALSDVMRLGYKSLVGRRERGVGD